MAKAADLRLVGSHGEQAGLELVGVEGHRPRDLVRGRRLVIFSCPVVFYMDNPYT